MGPLIIGAIALGGFLVYKLASAPRAPATPQPQQPQQPAAQDGKPRRTANTTADGRNVAATDSGSSGGGAGPGFGGGGGMEWTGKFGGGGSTTAPAAGDTSRLGTFRLSALGSGLNKLSGLRVDVSEDRTFGIDTLPDDGEGSLRSLVRSMNRIYAASAPKGALGLYPWDADFIRAKADVLVEEFGAERAAQRLRRIADEVEAAYATRVAISDADDAARAEAAIVDRAKRSFPNIMALPPSSKLSGELQSIALHMEWRARLVGGATDDKAEDIATGTTWVLYADPDYTPPSVAQLDAILARIVGIHGAGSPLDVEVRAIRDTIADGILQGGAPAARTDDADSYSYDKYIEAAKSIPTEASFEVSASI